MISGLVLKYLNGECFVIRRGYETTLPVSSSFCLTVPAEEIAHTKAFSDLVLMAVKDEDYDMGFQIQKTLGSKANEAFVFGRNEPALQHYHDHVAKFVSQT